MEVNTMAIGTVQTFECEEEIAIDAKVTLSLKVDIYEDEAATVEAKRIIWGTEKYYVKPYWKLNGKIVSQLCGTWRVKIDLESIGDAPEYTSEVREIAMNPCKEDEYSTVFVLQPDMLKPHEAGTVYIPSVTLSTIDPCGGEGYIWGFLVGPSVMFIQQKPEK